MTAPAILRQWNEDALNRAQAAAEALAESYPELSDRAQALKDAETARTRDYLHTETARLVALADLVEAIAEQLGAKEPDRDFSPAVGEDGDAALHEAGYDTKEDVRNASDEELLAVDGIGPKKLSQLRASV